MIIILTTIPVITFTADDHYHTVIFEQLFCTHFHAFTSQELGLPDSLKEEQKSKEDQTANVPACDICKKSHDGHLMALCDTCKNHYHIGCLDPPLSKVPKKSAKWGW